MGPQGDEGASTLAATLERRKFRPTASADNLAAMPYRRTAWLHLPHGRVAHVDLDPQRGPGGRRSFRWLLLGRMPPDGASSEARPNLAAGWFDMDADGTCRVDSGAAPLDTLEALTVAWRRAL